MRRLLLWAFNFAAGVSALAFVATCVLWASSYRARAGVGVQFVSRQELCEAVAVRGVLRLGNGPQRELDQAPGRWLVRTGKRLTGRYEAIRLRAYQINAEQSDAMARAGGPAGRAPGAAARPRKWAGRSAS